MWEKLKQVHYMFHIALVFIIFPVAGVISGEYPLFLLLWTAIFVVAYYAVLLSNHRLIQFFSWWLLISYIYYSSVFLNTGFTWYIFYLSNLLIYELDDISFKSWRFLTFIALQPAIVLTNYLMGNVGPTELLFYIVIFLFSDGMTFGLYRIQTAEQIKEEKVKQNAQLNLFLAENERNRIGRDLHDSLGHTFAMLSVKADLADQFLALGQVEKAQEQVQEIQAISQESMHQVREIVENLKQRTLVRELETVKQMLEVAQVKVEIQNNLDTASISPVLESALAMVSLELATNMIKHAKATQALLTYRSTETGVEMVAEDNGIGFDKVSDKDLHSIRERIALLGGELDISHQYKPTRIEIRIPYQERK